MNNEILIERRTQDSKNYIYNRKGVWLPRLIFWTEEESYIYNEWGKIIFDALSIFLNRHALKCIGFIKREKGIIDRVLKNPYFYYVYKKELSEEYINYRQDEGHESITFLIYDKALSNDNISRIKLCKNDLDRENLLCYGISIFELGIEEPVLEMCFSNLEDSFLSIFKSVCETYKCKAVLTDKHFLSDWVKSNPECFGKKVEDNWDSF